MHCVYQCDDGRMFVVQVETLGDAVYMVAGGVPERRSNHAVSVASVGLELIEKVRQMHFPCTANTPIQIRLGKYWRRTTPE